MLQNSFQAREIYEKSVEFFGEEYMEEKLFISFAQFEEAQKVNWNSLSIFFHNIITADLCNSWDSNNFFEKSRKMYTFYWKYLFFAP